MNNMLIKISEAGSIAIHAAALLAGAKKGDRISVNEIASIFGVSRDHLSKVMQRMVKAGFVSSDRGPRGGFSLTKPAEKIRLIDIYESIEGKCSLQGCLIEKKFCLGKKCVLGGLLAKINLQIFEYLKDTKLSGISVKPYPQDSTR